MFPNLSGSVVNNVEIVDNSYRGVANNSAIKEISIGFPHFDGSLPSGMDLQSRKILHTPQYP